jgi:uncharacterized protein YjbI with pentapeptide repeats
MNEKYKQNLTIQNRYFYTKSDLAKYFDSGALPKITFINRSFEKVNLRGSDFNTCKFKMTTFPQSSLEGIRVENVKIKFGESKERLEINKCSAFENYVGRSDNEN